MDWFNFALGFLVMVLGLTILIPTLSKKDFNITVSIGHWISAGIILFMYGIFLMIEAV